MQFYDIECLSLWLDIEFENNIQVGAHYATSKRTYIANHVCLLRGELSKIEDVSFYILSCLAQIRCIHAFLCLYQSFLAFRGFCASFAFSLPEATNAYFHLFWQFYYLRNSHMHEAVSLDKVEQRRLSHTLMEIGMSTFLLTIL